MYRRSAACMLLALLLGGAPSAFGQSVPSPGGSLSGSWFAPERAGEGFALEITRSGGVPTLVAYWFTYRDGRQLWLAGSAPWDEGEPVTVPMIATGGTGFGDNFDSADVETSPWGEIVVDFESCKRASVDYSVAASGETGTLELMRLTPALDGMPCAEARPEAAKTWSADSAVATGRVGKAAAGSLPPAEAVSGARATAGAPALSGTYTGSWMNRDRAGEGLFIEVDNRGDRPLMVVYWFTYQDGEQLWLVGAAPFDLDQSAVEVPVEVTRGAGFGDDFDPADVSSEAWGTLTLDFFGCNSLSLSYESGELTGSHQLTRLNAVPLGSECRPAVGFVHDFDNGSGGFSASFSDFSPGMEDGIEFSGEVAPLPEPLGEDERGFRVQSSNISDDLFVFLKRELGQDEGLKPNTRYRVHWKLSFASNAPTNCVGIGGPPGEGVRLKAGASTVEPMRVLSEDGDRFGMNVDKGGQSSSGPAATIVDNIANGIPCEESEGQFVRLARSRTHQTDVATDDQGRLWLLTGTESAFEGITVLYYLGAQVRLTELGPVDEPL